MKGSKGAVTLKILGVRVEFELSSGVLLGLFLLYGMSSLASKHELTLTSTFLAGALFATIAVACLILHGLAHCLVARHYKLSDNPSIHLFMFGSQERVAGLDDPTTTPGEEFLVVLAGPVISLILAGTFMLIARLGWHPLLIETGETLARLNLIWLGVNLIPAFPLDGGRILHAILWGILQERCKATRVSVYLTYVIASVIIGWSAYRILGSREYGYFWPGVLAVLVAGFAWAREKEERKIA